MEIPRHIGIIMDGNRRYAVQTLGKKFEGHDAGARKVEDVITWCKEYGVQELTLYAFSLENFNRAPQEVAYLMALFKKEFQHLASKENIEEKIRFIGRTELFPQDIQEAQLDLEEQTKNNTKLTLNFAMAYDGRAEIVDAVRKIVWNVQQDSLSPESITEADIEHNLYLQSQPDLIIRTSGEQRISGFLLWQASYAELYFSPKMWPEFGKEDLAAALTEYAQRQRRFGK